MGVTPKTLTYAGYQKAKAYIEAYEAQSKHVRTMAFMRSFEEYLSAYVPKDHAATLAMRFTNSAEMFGTRACWDALVHVARQLRADGAVAGLPVNEDTTAMRERAFNLPIHIPIWGA